jgi:hypothetical protein
MEEQVAFKDLPEGALSLRFRAATEDARIIRRRRGPRLHTAPSRLLKKGLVSL